MKIGITERGDASQSIKEWQLNLHNVNAAILITKNITNEFISAVTNINCIVHATITGWGGSSLEPNVPTWQESLIQYNKLRQAIPHNRIVLRIDPIIPTPEGIKKALNIAARFKHSRLRISFLDNYPHVKTRFLQERLTPLPYTFHADLSLRKQIAAQFINPEICGEPGMICTGCISQKDLTIFGLTANPQKDSFQRKDCLCLSGKTELLSTRGQCPHGCLYCYWH